MLFFLGALPNPLHGMSSINKKMLAHLGNDNIRVFNLLPSYAAKFYPSTLFILIKVIHLIAIFPSFIFQLIKYRKVAKVYFSISGDKGKLFDLPFMLVSGVFANNIYVHHHSFLYINKQDFLFKCLLWAGNNKIIHIALCSEMKAGLMANYQISNEKIDILSNIVFIENETHNTSFSDEIKTIGFLSNISFEKGIKEFIWVHQQLNKVLDHLIIAKIAGPFLGAAEQQYVEEMCRLDQSIKYVGSVYDEDKIKFFNDIDVLLFPTFNDAEPLTIYEAYTSSVPVIAWSRGCIAGMIGNGLGYSIDAEESYQEAALNKLIEWIKQPQLYKEVISVGHKKFLTYKKQCQSELVHVIKQLKS